MTRHRSPRAGRRVAEHRAALLDYAANAIAAATPLSPETLKLLTHLEASAPELGLVGLLPAASTLSTGMLTTGLLDDLSRRMRTRSRGRRPRHGFERRLKGLAELAGLDASSRAILGLFLRDAMLPSLSRLAQCVAETWGNRHAYNLCPDLVAVLTGFDRETVHHALRRQAPLVFTGLLRMDDEHDTLFVPPLILRYASDEFSDADARAALLGKPAAASLDWSDYAHLGKEAGMVAAVLAGALRSREAGVHVLLYGPPGTGKTEFAKTLARQLDVPLHPVAEADEEGDEPNRNERLAGWRLAQRLTATTPALLLLDEAEDLFADPKHASRVFLHRLLESTPTPTIWTVNDLDALSPAVRRRMTCCLEVKVPPVPVRAALWQRLAAAERVLLPEADAEALAREIAAPPALARSALRAARLAGGDPAQVRRALLGTARALFGESGRAGAPPPAAPCDPALLNADLDLASLAGRLARPGAPCAVSLLLSGPPGSGKSLYARHLAAGMGLEVMERRASDLLSMWVGGSEKAIAGAFAEAREREAFLILDEADGLLCDRAGAVRSWEVTQVNEMLTWMESHPLPFACTTNRSDHLDPASLRRFLVKARFDYLSPAQVTLAFERFFGLAMPAGQGVSGCLTPADFALVRRKAELMGQQGDAAALCDLLAAEAAGRRGPSRRIGYVAAA